MKKFAIILLAFIAVLAVILFLKMNGTIPNKADTSNHSDIAFQNSSTYSNEEIKELILKGKDNLNNMQNIYYEKWGVNYLFNKFYYKDSKTKRELYGLTPPNVMLTSTITIDEKEYYLFHDSKEMRISTYTSQDVDYGFEDSIIEEASSSLYEFTYLGDEILDEKDCILVKSIYQSTSSTLKKLLEKTGLPVYWVEKSTGFLIGDGNMHSNEDAPTLQTIYKNISFGTVQDSDFEIPAGYTVIK